MKIILALFIVTLHLNNSCVVAEECPENSWRHKHLRLGIFYTKQYYRSWLNTMEKEGHVKLSDAVKNIAERLSQFFSAKHFKTASIKFDVQENNVRPIDDEDLDRFNAHRSFRMHMTARLFCVFAQKKKKEFQQTWDYAFLLTDGQLLPAYTTGAVANVHTVCTAQNCAVVNFKSAVYGSSSEFLAYPKLLAYFLGLSFGLDHNRHMGIMRSRGDTISWSDQSKRHMQRYFDDRLELRCLEWSCGAYNHSGEIYSRPALVKKLNQLCGSIFPNMPAKLDQPKTNAEFNALARRRNRLREYVSFLLENRYWYRLENMCKGVPCVWRQKFRRTAFALYQEDMEGETCGDKKECKKGVCVGSAGVEEEVTDRTPVIQSVTDEATEHEQNMPKKILANHVVEATTQNPDVEATTESSDVEATTQNPDVEVTKMNVT